MPIVIAIASLFVIAGVAALLKRSVARKLPEVCVVCMGVSGTWIWVLAGWHAGRLSDVRWPLIAGMLMGGSVVGLMEQLRQRAGIGPTTPVGKAIALAVGFALAYAATQWWLAAIGAATFVIIGAALIMRGGARSKAGQHAADALKEKLDAECC